MSECSCHQPVDRVEKVLRRKQCAYLPQSLMGKAIGYALGEFTRLRRFLDDARIEIDNGPVENRTRPTAVGENWLFIGYPEAGQRSAIICTTVACCRRLGIDSLEYLRNVLERLPSMTNQESHRLTPAAWLAERTAQRQAKAA